MVIENLCGFRKEMGGGSALNGISWITVNYRKKTRTGFSCYINENVYSNFLRMAFSNVLSAEEK